MPACRCWVTTGQSWRGRDVEGKVSGLSGAGSPAVPCSAGVLSPALGEVVAMGQGGLASGGHIIRSASWHRSV